MSASLTPYMHIQDSPCRVALTPYSYAWDTDNDGNFDDADSLYVPLVFDEAGVHSVHLVITDLAAQSDTLQFDYNVLSKDTVRYSVEDLGIAESTFEVITVCTDQQAFAIDVVAGNGIPTSTSPGFANNMFDPLMAGAGVHYIAIDGDLCAPGAGFVYLSP